MDAIGEFKGAMRAHALTPGPAVVPPTTEASAAPQPVKFTVFRARHALSKTLTQLPDGTVDKDASGCALRRGRFATIAAGGLRGFGAMLANAKRTEAFCYGTCVGAECGTVVSMDQAKDGDISRTKEHWRYEPGKPGIVMLDFDPRPNGQALDRDTWLSQLYAAGPTLQCTEKLWRPSTSSLIYDRSGNELVGVAGQRLYLVAADASDIPRAGKALFERLWLAGHGHIEISEAVSLLVRAPVDRAVFSPERLDFVSGAVCRDGLRQGDLTCKFLDGAPLLDTKMALPDLSPAEREQYDRLVAAAKDAARPEAERVRAAYTEGRVQELVERGVPESDARPTVAAALEGGLLGPVFLLKFDRHGSVAVSDVLANLKRYDGATLADPLEPEYNGGRNVARLYANDGKPVIHSFAHGGKTYFLLANHGIGNAPPDDKPPPLRAYEGDPDARAYDRVEEDTLALEFISRNRDLIYVPAFGRWRRWNGYKWIEDEKLSTFTKIRELCRGVAPELGSGKERSQVLKSATVAGIERLARSDERSVIGAAELDSDPWVLNTPNGIIDLKTGAVKPNEPKAYLTRATATGMGDRPTPLWDRFLRKVTDDNAELIGFLQRVTGYVLTGSIREHVLFFFFGTGGNGKSVFLNTLTWLLADYAAVAHMSTFAESRLEQHPTDLAMLRGARLVTAQEIKQGQAWAEDKIKLMTGGDPITARFMRQDFFTYQPQFKLLLSGNRKPTLKAVDESVRRRFRIVPFTVTIPEARRDRDLSEKLKVEWPGILRWMVEGCLRWQAEGLEPPEVVQAATEQYLESMDVFSEWLLERCEVGKDYCGKFGRLYQDWRQFAELWNDPPGKHQEFVERLESHGFRLGRTNALGRHWVGLKLKCMSGQNQEVGGRRAA